MLWVGLRVGNWTPQYPTEAVILHTVAVLISTAISGTSKHGACRQQQVAAREVLLSYPSGSLLDRPHGQICIQSKAILLMDVCLHVSFLRHSIEFRLLTCFPLNVLYVEPLTHFLRPLLVLSHRIRPFVHMSIMHVKLTGRSTNNIP